MLEISCSHFKKYDGQWPDPTLVLTLVQTDSSHVFPSGKVSYVESCNEIKPFCIQVPAKCYVFISIITIHLKWQNFLYIFAKNAPKITNRKAIWVFFFWKMVCTHQMDILQLSIHWSNFCTLLFKKCNPFEQAETAFVSMNGDKNTYYDVSVMKKAQTNHDM